MVSCSILHSLVLFNYIHLKRDCSLSLGFFGNGAGAFLWRMRHNRNTPCHSLFEQAQMEAEIDVFEYSGLNNFVQHCSHDKIAIGGGNIHDTPDDVDGDSEIPPAVDLVRVESYGFGIALSEDLGRGSSSPCATFRNPSLVSNAAETKTFEIANMEVWTMTPAWDVHSAEKLEMTKYFVDQSIHSVDSSSIHSTYSDYGRTSTTRPGSPGEILDHIQEEFYRHVGQNDESDTRRTQWQYANMMM